MKILHILSQLPMKTGSGVYFSNLVLEFEKLGHENTILYANQEPFKIDIIKNQYEIKFKSENIPFPIAGMSDIMPYESSVYSNLKDDEIDIILNNFKEKLLYLKEKKDFDIIISHHLFLVTNLVREIFKDKLVLSFCHGTDLRQILQHKRFLNRLGNIKNLDKIFTVSEDDNHTISKLFNISEDKIKFVGGGFNHNIFNENYIPPEKYPLKLCYAGKISKSKGVFELAQTFPIVKEKFKNLEYHIIGNDIGKKSELESLAKDNKNFKVYNTKDQKSMADIIKKCHLFVLPSYYEALGLVAVEAMACKKYVVTSEIKGLKNLLKSKVNNSGVILYTKLPRLYDLDKPCEEDIPSYVNSLSENIITQFEKINNDIAFPDEILDEVKLNSWKNVACKINKELQSLISKQPCE